MTENKKGLVIERNIITEEKKETATRIQLLSTYTIERGNQEEKEKAVRKEKSVKKF